MHRFENLNQSFSTWSKTDDVQKGAITGNLKFSILLVGSDKSILLFVKLKVINPFGWILKYNYEYEMLGGREQHLFIYTKWGIWSVK